LISTVEGSPDGVRSANERPVTSFSYVYDCGSERSDAFNSEMSLYRAACDGKTDVLFVSHLHADHINGIDRLQAMAPAKTVIVPYLDAVERCFSCFPILSAVRYPDRRSTTLRAP
jgi:phosphoribosyl 1,2-cyclic phosphodiesterase